MAIDLPKTEKDFFLEYPSFKNVDRDQLDISYSYGESGFFLCGYFNKLPYVDIVTGNCCKGRVTKNRKMIKSNEFWKCFFKGSKLICAEKIVNEKCSERIYVVYERNRIIYYDFFEEDLSRCDIAQYSDENGFIKSYLILSGFSAEEILLLWEKYEYVYDQNGITEMVYTDNWGTNVDYLFCCESGMVEGYFCDNVKYKPRKKVSAFLGKYNDF